MSDIDNNNDSLEVLGESSESKSSLSPRSELLAPVKMKPKLPVKFLIKKKANKNKRTTSQNKAGLVFPVGRIKSNLKKLNKGSRVSPSAAVCLAGVLQYLCAELIDTTKNNLLNEGKKKKKRKTIITNDLYVTMKTDRDFKEAFPDIYMPDVAAIF